MPRSASTGVTAEFKKNGRTVARVSVSRSYGGVSQADNELAQAVADDLLDTVKDRSKQQFFKVDAQKLAAEIAGRIDRELMKVGNFISAHLIGQTSGAPGGETTITLDEADTRTPVHVTWRNLSLSTVRGKMQNKRSFFLHTGDLRSDIRAHVGEGLVKMNEGFRTKTRKGEVVHGPVRIWPVYNSSESSFYKIGQIEVNLFTKSRANRIASIVNELDVFDHTSDTRSDIQYLAQKLGLSQDSIGKLLGPHGREWSRAYRPLLEPAIAYFVLNRVPRAVDRALRKYATKADW